MIIWWVRFYYMLILKWNHTENHWIQHLLWFKLHILEKFHYFLQLNEWLNFKNIEKNTYILLFRNELLDLSSEYFSCMVKYLSVCTSSINSVVLFVPEIPHGWSFAIKFQKSPTYYLISITCVCDLITSFRHYTNMQTAVIMCLSRCKFCSLIVGVQYLQLLWYPNVGDAI